MKLKEEIIDYLIIVMIGIGLFLGLLMGILGIILGIIGGISMYLIHTAFFYYKVIKQEVIS